MISKSITIAQQTTATFTPEDLGGFPTTINGLPSVTLMDDNFVNPSDKGVVTLVNNADGTATFKGKAVGTQNALVSGSTAVNGPSVSTQFQIIVTPDVAVGFTIAFSAPVAKT